MPPAVLRPLLQKLLLNVLKRDEGPSGVTQCFELSWVCRQTCRHSDPSRAAVSDGYHPAFDDDRDVPRSIGQLQHPLHVLRRGLDVHVLDVVTLFREFLTGRVGIGSGVLAEDDDLFAHRCPPRFEWKIRKRKFTPLRYRSSYYTRESGKMPGE